MSLPTYIGFCCREWPLAVGFKVGRCGYCGEKPVFLRHDTENPDLPVPGATTRRLERISASPCDTSPAETGNLSECCGYCNPICGCERP